MGGAGFVTRQITGAVMWRFAKLRDRGRARVPSSAMHRVVAALALSFTLFGCASSGRDEVRDGLVDQLVDEGGLDRSVAECVVDGFFDGRDNDELNAFFDRDELTEDERAEFLRLGEECAD